jgi:hypothetical protein
VPTALAGGIPEEATGKLTAPPVGSARVPTALADGIPEEAPGKLTAQSVGSA